MQHSSLFGHLASRFSSGENIATEALNYILSRSSVARDAFVDFASLPGADVPDGLLFRTQATGGDNAIPDLVGTDSELGQVLLVEAKFWAGLTPNQPVTYLRRLPASSDGLLLFIAPAMRLPSLWPELVRRCQEGNVAMDQSRSNHTQDLRTIGVGPNHMLALTSWRAVLASIQRALESENEALAVSDVQQLQGLCERMDSDAFLPLRSEELTSNIGARIVQYFEILDDVIRDAVAEELVSLGGLSTTRGHGFYGRYVRLHDVVCLLWFSGHLWSRLGATPLWLRIHLVESQLWSRDALASFERALPARLFIEDDYIHVPLHLPTQVERQEVVSALLEQVREVATLLDTYERPQQGEEIS